MGAPVIVGNLHSQIAPAAAGVKAARPDARIAYVMTDAAALPLGPSRLVRDLQAARLIGGTPTPGPAAGIAYVMTAAAALPLGLSRLVRDLKSASLIDVTLTAGQAFGGDHE